MIKITIDENVLTLTPRSKKIGKRLLRGWLLLQIFTIFLILSGVALFVWAGTYDYFGEMEEDQVNTVHMVQRKIE